MDATHGFTFTVWLNEWGDEHLSPAPSATKSGLTKFLKLIGQRKSSSHMTRTRQLALNRQCHQPPWDREGDAPPQPPRRKRLVEDVVGTDIKFNYYLWPLFPHYDSVECLHCKAHNQAFQSCYNTVLYTIIPSSLLSPDWSSIIMFTGCVRNLLQNIGLGRPVSGSTVYCRHKWCYY